MTVSFPSLTAILVGILPETDFILATTYICLSPLTQKVTSRPPLFPLLNPASKHDSHGFPETYFLLFRKYLLCKVQYQRQLAMITQDSERSFLYISVWHVSQRFIADLSLMNAISGLLLRKCLFFQNQDIPVF